MAKTLDNITAVMIAFNNFEVTTSVPDDTMVQPIDSFKNQLNLNAQRKSLEPVQEELLESDVETPV